MADERIDQLEAQVADLAERLSALEMKTTSDGQQVTDDVPPGTVDFRLLKRLQDRQGADFDADGVGGAVVYAGSFRSESVKRVWYVERAVPYLGRYSADTLAALLAALGNPQRLLLLQELLHGPQDRQQLQDALEISSPGQLYHHLHSLLNEGVIMQQRRGVYALTPNVIVPLLAILAASIDIVEEKEEKEVDTQ